MLELVKQEDNSMNTPFREMYGPNEEGIHHTALIVDNFDKAVAHFESFNMPLLTSCTTAQGRVEFGFIHARTTLGHMIEIYNGYCKDILAGVADDATAAAAAAAIIVAVLDKPSRRGPSARPFHCGSCPRATPSCSASAGWCSATRTMHA